MTPALVRVTKKFSFDMAHALYGYDGPCKNIHGHTYHLSVTLLGPPETKSGAVKLGMVVDFGDLKEMVKTVVLETFDHALVLNEGAPYVSSEVIAGEFEKLVLVPWQPTCENLLLHFVDLLKERFPPPTRLICMRLEETPTSYPEWWESDNPESGWD